MFDCTGRHARDHRDEMSDASERGHAAPSRPVDFVVRKDGKPFALLNATPELARSTVAAFRRTEPGAAWTVFRV